MNFYPKLQSSDIRIDPGEAKQNLGFICSENRRARETGDRKMPGYPYLVKHREATLFEKHGPIVYFYLLKDPFL